MDEQTTLEALYAPLRDRLSAQDATQRSLEFYVRRRVDVGAWAARGEDYLDLRRAGRFQGHGALEAIAQGELAAAWQTGGAADVADAMAAFVTKNYAALLDTKLAEVPLQDLARWIFSTDHITLEYGIRYERIELSRLSPGMRGIVLLMVYLEVDEWDTRPLVVDQPEENLDPQSIYRQLVTYFRQAKRRRQVILVTHNPNLVVNADADQVIVANAKREGVTELPRISYYSGGLEDPKIRTAVCEILEGGERAFLERELRYAIKRDRRLT